jgi:hypothetical protein
MGANLGRAIVDYSGFIESCRERADELALSRAEIDRLAGLPSGYAGKLLGKDGAGPRKKRVYPISLGSMLGVLGLRMLLIEDETATARTLALRVPVDRANQRFGNKCNSKRLLSFEDPLQLAAPPREPPPTSRAHLHVVQSRRGGKYGRF